MFSTELDDKIIRYRRKTPRIRLHTDSRIVEKEIEGNFHEQEIQTVVNVDDVYEVVNFFLMRIRNS